MSQLAKNLRISDLVDEYNTKMEKINDNIKAFETAGKLMQSNACIGGTYGGEHLDIGAIGEWKVKSSLKKSAWKHVYNGLNISRVASANDKQSFERLLEHDAPDFTLENIRATFGDYILNPRQNILRGLAEVFCSLDPYYKSHNKVKIGSDKMPKRVILNVSSTYGWGFDKLKSVINALAAYQELPLLGEATLTDGSIDHAEAYTLMSNGLHCKKLRGIELRRFKNGNAHLIFDKWAIVDINKALNEFYGDVLPDTTEEKPEQRAQSTAVSKDLQYYPTPVKVVEDILSNYSFKGLTVLEPSCGCGRFMEGLRKEGAIVHGVEVDAGRARIAKDKGFHVMTMNFLEVQPTQKYDAVVMNPPFYGKHYQKHVEHAKKFVKEGGKLIAILPSSARYDHDFAPDGRWQDLPVGSFSESGTNINTSIYTWFQK